MLEGWAKLVSSKVTSSEDISWVLSTVQRTLSNEARRKNSRNKLTHLPPAVLLCIGDHLRSDDPDFLRSAVSLSCSCYALGQSMLKIPELWARFTFSSSLVRIDPDGDLLRSLVARAGPTLPLAMNLLLDYFVPSINYLPSISMISATIGRIERLDLTLDLFLNIVTQRYPVTLLSCQPAIELWQPIHGALDRPAPLIRSLSIRVKLYHVLRLSMSLVVPFNIFVGHAPSLRRLALEGPVLGLNAAYPAFANITTLSYEWNTREFVPAESLHAFLSLFPSLTEANLIMPMILPWPKDKPRPSKSRSTLTKAQIACGSHPVYLPFVAFFTQSIASVRHLALHVGIFTPENVCSETLRAVVMLSAVLSEAHFGKRLVDLKLHCPDSEPFRLMFGSNWLRRAPLSAAFCLNLVSMTLHEFLWPSETVTAGNALPLPATPKLQTFRLILASCAEYRSDYHVVHHVPDAYGVFQLPRLAISASASVAAAKWHVPALQTVQLSYRLCGECFSGYNLHCSCSSLLSVSLGDVYDFISTHVIPEGTVLQMLALEGCDPIDINLAQQLERLHKLARHVEILPLPPPDVILPNEPWDGDDTFACFGQSF